MIMKRFSKFITPMLAAALMCGLSSCEDLKFGNDFLDKPVTEDVTMEDVYSSKVYAEQALAYVYKQLPDGLCMRGWSTSMMDIVESMTDLNNSSRTWGQMAGGWYAGSISAASSDDKFPVSFSTGGYWTGVRAAWLFIENVDSVPDMTDEEKLIRKSEAYGLMSVWYTDMFRAWGGLPLVKKAYSAADPTDDLARATLEETLEFIIDIMDTAIEGLPWTVASTADDGRITKAAIMALKTRLLLFAASPLFNNTSPYMEGEASDMRLTWFGGYDAQRWQDTVDACAEFISALDTNGYYMMVDGLNERARDDYDDAYFTRGTTECLISCRYVATYPSGIWASNGNWYQQCSYGIANTTLNYVDMFDFTDGTEFDWDNPDHRAHPFFAADGTPRRDPRLYESVNVVGDEYQGGYCDSWIGGAERANSNQIGTKFASGFCMRKFHHDVTNTNSQPYSWPYLRLPEAYLNYAEALNEVYGGPTALAYEMINKVRARVDMPALSGLDYESFKEAVLKERCLEFGYEHIRYYDMNRHMMEDVYRKDLYGLDTTLPTGVSAYSHDIELVYEIVPISGVERVWKTSWSNKYYLQPFPNDEVNKDYGLTQNPGW